MPTKRPAILAGEQLPKAAAQDRSRRKRDALLAAALKLFAKRGFDATTIEAIAKTAGVAVGGFYQHFGSKRQLLIVLMDRLLSDIEAFDFGAAPGAGDGRQTVAAIVRAGLAADWAHAGVYRAWSEAVPRDPQVARYDERIRRWASGRIAGALRAFGVLPEARRDVDVDVLAELLNDLFWRVAETPAARRAAVAEVVVNLVTHAILRDRAAP